MRWNVDDVSMESREEPTGEEKPMSESIVKEKPAVPPKPVEEDLSREIAQTMERKSDERMKVVRVFDNFYRCNWWVQDKAPHAFWLATGTIRKSRFLRATRTSEGLRIDQVK
jgi:hypothetical protein